MKINDCMFVCLLLTKKNSCLFLSVSVLVTEILSHNTVGILTQKLGDRCKTIKYHMTWL